MSAQTSPSLLNLHDFGPLRRTLLELLERHGANIRDSHAETAEVLNVHVAGRRPLRWFVQNGWSRSVSTGSFPIVVWSTQ